MPTEHGNIAEGWSHPGTAEGCPRCGSERSKERSTSEAKRSEYVPDSGLWTAEEREAALQEAISLQDGGEIWQSVNPVEVERATDTVSALIRALEDEHENHVGFLLEDPTDHNEAACNVCDLLSALKGEK